MNKKLSLIYPVSKGTPISQRFGENLNPFYKELGLIGHNGVDFAFPMRSPVYATHDGKVVYAGMDGNEGYGVVIRTNETFEYKGEEVYFKSIYWHLLPAGILVKVGQKVETGDLIALGDNTGLSTGSHLHFGLKPQMKGENDWTWLNTEQNNGYFGAISPEPYWSGYYPEDIKILLKIKSIAEQIINLLSKVVNLF